MLNLKALKEAAQAVIAQNSRHSFIPKLDADFRKEANPETILSLIERCEELEGVLSTIDAAAPDLPDALWNQIDAALSKADATS